MSQVAVPPVAALRQRLAAPLAVGLGGVAAVAAVAVRDPNVPGNWGSEGVGLCPFLALTGLWCPLCGGLRAVHSLTSLDLVAAISTNVVVVGLVVVAVAMWLSWVLREVRGRPVTTPGRAGQGIVVGVLQSQVGIRLIAIGLIGFTILRNLPVGSVLAP